MRKHLTARPRVTQTLLCQPQLVTLGKWVTISGLGSSLSKGSWSFPGLCKILTLPQGKRVPLSCIRHGLGAQGHVLCPWMERSLRGDGRSLTLPALTHQLPYWSADTKPCHRAFAHVSLPTSNMILLVHFASQTAPLGLEA